MVKEVSYIRLAIHQLKNILTQEKDNCKGNILYDDIFIRNLVISQITEGAL